VSDEVPFALATVVRVAGSGPRAPGACMAVAGDGRRFIGSASSGCLEAVVMEAAKAVLASGGTRRLRFGPDGPQPWSDGLTCGGWVDVRVDPWWRWCGGSGPAVAEAVIDWMDTDATGVVVSRGAAHAAFDAGGRFVAGDRALASAMAEPVAAALATGLPPHERQADRGDEPVFLHVLARRPRLVMVGAVDVAVHLVALARECGWAIVVVDPREAFVAAERFPQPPDRLMRSWPERIVPELDLGPRDAAVVLTHDAKIDDPALLAFLETRVGYIGALGSTRSHAARLDRLAERGADPSALARIDGPAGIHLAVGSAAGVALGIMAGVERWLARRDRAALAAAPATPASMEG